MSTKAENRFIRRVHKHLKEPIYAEKTSNPFRGGIFDVIYEGPSGYFFIEYKWLAKRPVRSFTPKLTPLQLDWGERAARNHRGPWVVVGFPGGCFLLYRTKHWDRSVKTSEVDEYTEEELARLITARLS